MDRNPVWEKTGKEMKKDKKVTLESVKVIY